MARSINSTFNMLLKVVLHLFKGSVACRSHPWLYYHYATARTRINRYVRDEGPLHLLKTGSAFVYAVLSYCLVPVLQHRHKINWPWWKGAKLDWLNLKPNHIKTTMKECGAWTELQPNVELLRRIKISLFKAHNPVIIYHSEISYNENLFWHIRLKSLGINK